MDTAIVGERPPLSLVSDLFAEVITLAVHLT